MSQARQRTAITLRRLLNSYRHPAAAKARRAIQLAIHWAVMTINPGGCALKRTRPSVIVMSGMPRQPCQPFEQE
jgi:hypothetical protein